MKNANGNRGLIVREPRRTRIAAVVCRAGNLTDALAESLRVEVHKQLDEVCRWGERCEFVPTVKP